MPEAARAALRGAIERLAPRWIDPLVLQPAGLYLELSGEEIRRRAFLVADENGAELCLRPDMTVPALRFALEQGLTGVIAYEGLVFRRQQQGSARETEFIQLGAEWLGDSDDSEVIACALEACRAANASPGLKLGDLALVHAFIESCGLAAPWIERMKRAVHRPHGLDAIKAEIARDAPLEGGALADALAAAPEEDAEAALADLLAVARITPVGSRSLTDIARRLRARGDAHRAPKPAKEQIALIETVTNLDHGVEKGIAAAEKLLSHRCVEGGAARTAFEAALTRLHNLEKAVDLPTDTRFAPGLGRGLAYYDGFVFELEARGLGARASLGGGGRYDGLVKRLTDHPDRPQSQTSRQGAPEGARSLGGAGFALRPARIAEAAE
jgi:ATP phosphoribosyltransferase regulatory subunit